MLNFVNFITTYCYFLLLLFEIKVINKQLKIQIQYEKIHFPILLAKNPFVF